MSIIVSSPVVGSLKIQNTSASPQSNYLANNQTVNIVGDVFQQSVNILNSNQQVIVALPLNKITQIAASTQSFGLQFAVDAIATMIMK